MLDSLSTPFGFECRFHSSVAAPTGKKGCIGGIEFVTRATSKLEDTPELLRVRTGVSLIFV